MWYLFDAFISFLYIKKAALHKAKRDDVEENFVILASEEEELKPQPAQDEGEEGDGQGEEEPGGEVHPRLPLLAVVQLTRPGEGPEA